MAARNIPGRTMLLDQENQTDYNCGYFSKIFFKNCIKSLTYPTALWYNIIAKGKGSINSLFIYLLMIPPYYIHFHDLSLWYQ